MLLLMVGVERERMARAREMWFVMRVLTAAGIHSEGRKAVLGDQDKPPVLTGLAAYRATIPAEKIKSDPDTAWLMDDYIQHGW